MLRSGEPSDRRPAISRRAGPPIHTRVLPLRHVCREHARLSAVRPHHRGRRAPDDAGPAARAFRLIGVLGGFTTFSSFTFETFALLRDAELTRAAVNAIGQLIIGLVALWAGYVAGRLV